MARSCRTKVEINVTHVKAESLVDEERVESIETTDNKSLEQDHEAQGPNQRVLDGFPSLVALPLLLLDTLVVLSHTLQELGLVLLAGPTSLHGGVGEPDENDSSGEERDTADTESHGLPVPQGVGADDVVESIAEQVGGDTGDGKHSGPDLPRQL